MRIISGKYKGRRIFPPKNLPVRPTTDMSKEALFNVLRNRFDFEDLQILDLFTGTGNISFEFASRGCSQITAVDKDFGCIAFVRQITKEYDFGILAIQSEVIKFLEKCNASYTIIFADPPYSLDHDFFEKLVLLILKKELLQKNGMLVVEHSERTTLENLPNFSFKKRYGGSVFSFFEIEG